MSGGAWMFLWMMLVLKIPIAALLYLVWWSARQAPDVASDDRGGGSDRHPHRDRPRGPRPRPPRRGPHADPPPLPPARVRARGRRLSPSHD